MLRNLALPALTLLIAACASTAPKPGAAGPGSASPAPPPQAGYTPPADSRFRVPQIMHLPGLENVIGASTQALRAQFGTPRLDVQEGDARKLQFSAAACVLDIYLYPLQPGAQPSATYVDARRASDGRDVDRAACVAAMRASGK